MRRCREYALNFVNNNKMKNRKPWSFCETPEEKCTMNYCDDNGCQNRKRNYVQGNELIADVVVPKGTLCDVCGSDNIIEAPSMGRNCNSCNPI